MRRFVLSLLLLATGCNFGLDPASIVKTPRILAIVSEAPESAPGDDIVFDAMISIPADAPRPLRLRWQTCVDVASIVDNMSIPVPDEFRATIDALPRDCTDEMLAEGEPFVVDGARTRRFADFASATGAAAPAFQRLLDTTGFVIFADLEVLDANGVVLVSGFKRAAFTGRATPTTNPPRDALTFRFGDEVAIVPLEETFLCGTLDGRAPSAPVDSDVELAPLIGEGETERWLETYPVFDFTGGIAEGHENAFYTWFATAGSISTDTTHPPDRASTWHTPDDPGPQTLWLVVRDGHLGTTACRLEVEVVAPPVPPT